MIQELHDLAVGASLAAMAALLVGMLLVSGVPEVKGDPLSPRRKYTVLGKESLTNAEWRIAGPESRFFKVRVSLP